MKKIALTLICFSALVLNAFGQDIGWTIRVNSDFTTSSVVLDTRYDTGELPIVGVLDIGLVYSFDRNQELGFCLTKTIPLGKSKVAFIIGPNFNLYSFDQMNWHWETYLVIGVRLKQ